jgi:hypothetical protein
MKKIVFSMLLTGFLVACNKETKDHNLHLMGNIDGLKQGTLYIHHLKDSAFVMLDSIKIEGNSSFESFIQLNEPEMLYLFLDKGQTNSMDNSLSFFAEPGKMTVDTQLETFYAAAKVTGSENQKLYEEYKKANSRYNNEQLELIGEEIRAQRFNRKKDYDSIVNRKENVLRRKFLYTVNFALNHKNKEIAPYIMLSEAASVNTKYLDTVSNSLTPEIANSKYGKLLKEWIAERKQ